MDSDRRGSLTCLPAFSLGLLADAKINIEKLSPKAPSALGIISGKLDQDSGYAFHDTRG
jgi:hypothetical protein